MKHTLSLCCDKALIIAQHPRVDFKDRKRTYAESVRTCYQNHSHVSEEARQATPLLVGEPKEKAKNGVRAK